MKNIVAFDGENFRVRITSRLIREVPQEFEIVERPSIVLCIPFMAEGGVLLVSQYRAAINRINLEFPGGRVGTGENLQSALRRELLEEIGFVSDSNEHVGHILTAPHFSDERVDLFVAKGRIEQEAKPTAKEDALQTILVPWKSINALILEGRLSDAKSIAAYSLATASGVAQRMLRS